LNYFAAVLPNKGLQCHSWDLSPKVSIFAHGEER
jgi:hypothetical protein